jgi:catechol-2,3-dioxygenase
MPINNLNHAVLYVRDARRSAAFYTDVLGFVVRHSFGEGQAVFLTAPGSTNDHDLGLFSIGADAASSPAGSGAVGMYHLAWQVDTLSELERLRKVLVEHRSLVGASDHGVSKSLYARDADGLEFEVMWAVPSDLLDERTKAEGGGTRPLDLAAEIARYGSTTVSTG